MTKSQELYQKAKKIIPGGTQLFSKRPEMFLPEFWPSYYAKSKGCEVWDMDGRKYTDMSYMGIGCCPLGYADEDVNAKVAEAIGKGNVTTLNAPEEVYLAELLCELHPWAKMVRYVRTGGEAMSVAVRIARAKSRRDVVLFSGYHGWHDWYLAANLSEDKALDGHLLPGLEPRGVPRALRGTSYPFTYNNTEEFTSLVEKYGKEVGVVVLESVRSHFPKQEFLKTIRRITKELDIVLVVDEITAAWRMNLGGAHLLFDFEPDIAVFAKAISNGYPMAAVIGKSEVMEAAQESFISSTYWTDRIGVVAALATIEKLKKNNVPEYLMKTGKIIQDGWKETAAKNNLNIEVYGVYPVGHFKFNYDNALVLKTLFTQLMLERGFLATTAIYVSYAHKEQQVSDYLKAVDESFRIIAGAVREGNAEKHLKGPVCHSGFKRLT